MGRVMWFSSGVGLLLWAGLSVGAQAVSEPTGSVKGRAPVAQAVALNNESYPTAVGAWVGHTLSVGYGFSDADGDVESGAAFQWLRNGAAISGATASAYTTQSADAKTRLDVRVTPQTDPAITDPASGVAVTVGVFIAASGIIDRFLKPDRVERNWSAANSYCQSQGARLPTKAELETVYLDGTTATALGTSRYDMCSLYGWPLSLWCGAVNNDYYWSGTSAGVGQHVAIRMTDGLGSSHYTSDAYPAYVACFR